MNAKRRKHVSALSAPAKIPGEAMIVVVLEIFCTSRSMTPALVSLLVFICLMQLSW